jgi:cold shock CspA family protein
MGGNRGASASNKRPNFINMATGTVARFKSEHGVGWIKPDRRRHHARYLFFRISFDGPEIQVGTRVSFTQTASLKGPAAEDIELVEGGV